MATTDEASSFHNLSKSIQSCFSWPHSFAIYAKPHRRVWRKTTSCQFRISFADRLCNNYGVYGTVDCPICRRAHRTVLFDNDRHCRKFTWGVYTDTSYIWSAYAAFSANISFSDVWMASYNYVQNASATYNPSANYNQLNITSTSLGGNQIALRGFLDRAVTGNPGYSIGVQGLANSTSQDAFGVQGLAFSNSSTRAGGYFEALTYTGASQAYAYVGTSVGGINRKITGINAVSEIIPTPNHGRITMTAPESPEYWYQDYGTAEMVNGRAHVDIDPILADIVIIDAQNPIRAFFTPQDMLYFNGAAIVNQTATGFDIVELNGGSNNGKVQYQIIVRPKTGYGEGRFPQAPGPAYLKADKEPAAAKTLNQPNDGRTIFYWPADHIVYKYNPEDMIPIGDVVPAGPNAGKIKLGNGEYREDLPAERISTEKK
jgi:hypothetical protein